MHRFATAAASFRARTEDRATVLSSGDHPVVCVADGSGGVSGAAKAVELFVAGVQRAVDARAFDLSDAHGWVALFTDIDQLIESNPIAGETTGIALAVTSSSIVGASVGDSRAWLFGPTATELTKDQVRKPRLGTRRAEPRSFSAPAVGTLLVGTDGLFDHAPIDDIASLVRTVPSPNAAEALVDLLRHRFRALPDDVAVVIGLLDGA